MSEENATTRIVARALDIDRSTVVRWINEVGSRCKTPLEVSRQLQPRWYGILGFDGKPIVISGRKKACLLAADIISTDIVHCTVEEAEDEESSRRFLTAIRDESGYPLLGAISDLGRGRAFVKLFDEIFPSVPHQACIAHFARYAAVLLPVSEKSKHAEENRLLRGLVNNLIFAANFNDAEEILERLLKYQHLFPAKNQKAVIRSLERNFDLLTAHFHCPMLESTNNVTENIIKQLVKKLYVLSAFGSRVSASNFVNLWVMCYRFKPLTSSNYEYRNHLSPLQLARAEIDDVNWLKFALNRHN